MLKPDNDPRKMLPDQAYSPNVEEAADEIKELFAELHEKGLTPEQIMDIIQNLEF
jgi:pullulanase/glycogen debranching enzyme